MNTESALCLPKSQSWHGKGMLERYIQIQVVLFDLLYVYNCAAQTSRNPDEGIDLNTRALDGVSNPFGLDNILEYIWEMDGIYLDWSPYWICRLVHRLLQFVVWMVSPHLSPPKSIWHKVSTVCSDCAHGRLRRTGWLVTIYQSFHICGRQVYIEWC